MDNELAPVALFVYDRLDTLKQTVKSLLKNNLAVYTDLYIYSDGGKDAKSRKAVGKVRHFLSTISGFRRITIIERETNYYLERNIIEGVTEVVDKHGKVIVLEDDVCVNSYFLQYMNDALNLYEKYPQVMHISSINHFDVQSPFDANFTSLMECGWGWATWRDRWECFKHFTSKEDALQELTAEMKKAIEYNGRFPCLQSLERNPIPWDICWTIAIHKNKGYCLEPLKPISMNIGLYKGIHYRIPKLLGRDRYDRPFSDFQVNTFPSAIELNPDLEYMLFNHFEGFAFQYNMLGKCVRRIYKLFCK